MPAPLGPNDFKDLVPGTSGNFCEKFIKSLKLPDFVYRIVAYIWKENGEFTDEFKADICALGCIGGGGGPGGEEPSTFPAPIVSATDGAYADKIQITWTDVVGATLYDLYRHTVNDPLGATPLAHDLATGVYDDTTINAGQYYYYWMKARNAAQTSNFSQGDRGHAGTVATTLPAVTDLTAGRGLGFEASGPLIPLVWTKVPGAETYDIYTNTVDDFSTSTLHASRAPFNRETTLSSGPTPTFVDNNTEVVYHYTPSSLSTRHYFWVIAKRGGPPVQSLPSNSAMGWAVGFADGTVGPTAGSIEPNLPVTISAGFTKMRFKLTGAGASGAGGGGGIGGGGGGGAAIVVGEYTFPGVIGGTSKIRMRSDPESDPAPTPAETDGPVASRTYLEYSAAGDFNDTILIAELNPAGAGDFNPAGGGLGGAGGTVATINGSVVNSESYVGRAGLPAVANKGGRGGNTFGGFLNPAAHVVGYTGGGYSSISINGSGGGGSYAAPAGALGLATGGPGKRTLGKYMFKV